MRSLRLGGSVVFGVSLAAAMTSACASGGAVPQSIEEGGKTSQEGGGSLVDDSSIEDSSVSDSSVTESSVNDSPAGDDVSEDASPPQESGPVGDVDSGSTGPGGPEASAPAEGGIDSGTEGTADASSDAPTEAAPLLDSGTSCTTSSTTNYCSSLPPLAAVPVIDGVLDCGPALVAMPALGWTPSSGAPSSGLPEGNSASIAVAWRPNGLYVFVNVVTPVVIPGDPGSPPFYGSAVEVYVDSAAPTSSTYPNPGAIQLVAEAPSGTSPATIGEGYRDTNAQQAWPSTEFGTYPTKTGFILEGFVSATDLGLTTWALAASDQIGLDIGIDVSFTTTTPMSAQGHRAGEYFFNVGGAGIGAPYTDPRSFCAPTLASQ